MTRFFLFTVFSFFTLVSRVHACGCNDYGPIPEPGESSYYSNCIFKNQYSDFECFSQRICALCTPNGCSSPDTAMGGCVKYYDFSIYEKSNDEINNPSKQCGSIINVNQLTVGEVAPLIGTNLNLVYHSNRVAGFKEGFTYKQNIDQGASEPDLEEIHITDTYLGSGSSNSYLPNVYPEHTFTWNGLDHSSNLEPSVINVELKVEYEHTGSIFTTEYVQNIIVGGFQAKVLGFGGWTLSNVHFYDPLKQSVYLGSGDTKSIKAFKVQETSGEFEIQDDSDLENPPTFSHYLIISDNKNEAYIFNTDGFHIETRSAKNNSTILTITYDSTNRIISVEDNYNNEIEITYTLSSVSIEAPNGKVTTINLDTNGWAEEVVDPLNKKHEMTYSVDGLMLTFKNPEGLVSTFAYDSQGRLEEDANTAGHEITFDILSAVPNTSREISSTSKLGRTTNYNTTLY